MSIQQLRNLTTLCYIEQDGKYLMLHRVKKEMTLTKTNGSAWVVISRRTKARRTVCSGK